MGFTTDPAWFFEEDQRRAAVEALQRYLDGYTGSWFERLADHEHPNEITARDLVAVSCLSVEIPAATSIWVLNDGAAQVSSLLSRVPTSQRIWSDDVDLTEGGPLWQLWDALRNNGWRTQGKGMGRTKTSKLLAAKRPHIVPVWDSLVSRALFTEREENDWQLWHERLRGADGEQLRHLVEDVRSEADVPVDMSILRVVDVVVWMREEGRGRGPRPKEST